MRERPILFSAPMVRAILDGSKTQTRRVVKLNMAGRAQLAGKQWHCADPDAIAACPYGRPGDRLWVRERIELVPDQEPDDGTGDVHSIYAADGSLTPADAWPWRRPYLASIHCPRGLSRITLDVTGVRVERLQAISEADADAEGCERLDSERYEHDFKLCPQCGGTGLYVSGGLQGVTFDTDCLLCDTYSKRYRHLWESINGAGSWEANPWVWVVEFKRVMA